MIYDTLFGLDANFTPQPQMVGKWGVSDDKLTYTFELRDGLKFSDGAAVTAADCVASVRRWAARDGAGQTMLQRVKDTPVVDDKTFQHRAVRALRARDRRALHALDLALLHDAQEGRRDRSEPADPRDHRLRPVPLQSRRDAPRQPPRLRPQPELRAARRAALRHGRRQGGQARPRHLREHRRRADRARALQTGEIDFYEVPPQDLVDELEKDPNLTVRVLNKTGHIGFMRLNHLHPPFDNVEARRAMLHLVNQADVMRAIFGESK